MAMFSPKKRLKVGALFEVGINVHVSQNMGQKPRVSNKSNTWFWWMSIDVDSSTTLSLKQNSYWQTTCNGRKMPKKFLIYVFLMTLGPPHVVQLSVNFWYLGLFVLGANLVLGSVLVGNHLSKVAPKLENSLLILFSLALASQPFIRCQQWLLFVGIYLFFPLSRIMFALRGQNWRKKVNFNNYLPSGAIIAKKFPLWKS